MIYLILFLTIVLRFLFTAEMPPSLNWDEISHGYNAYSILKTGSDEWGNFLPSIFRAYGDYKLPVYIYLTSVSELFIGLNPFAVRLPSILAGIGTVYFTYLLVLRLFKENKQLALLSAFLVAVEPWTFFIGRPAFEANVAIFFFVAATYLFLKGVQENKSSIASIFLFGLTVWTYNSYRIITPLFLIALHFIYRKELKNIIHLHKTSVKKILLIAALFFIPMFYQLINPVGTARYSKVAIIDEGALNKINERRGNLQLKYSPIIAKLLANKITFFSSEFAKNYLSYFNPRFLFFKGGNQYQFSVPNRGLLYLINLPFFFYGIYLLLRQRSKEGLVLLTWLLLFPIAGSLTRESPHVLRAVTMLPIPMVITAIGIFNVINNLKDKNKTIALIIYVFTILLFMESYLLNYFTKYKTNYSESWQYGYKQVAEYLMENKDNYAKVVMTKKYGEPHEFLLFYLKVDPKSYIDDKNLNRFYQSDWWWVDGFDKYYFVNDWDIPKTGSKFVQESKKTVDCRQAKCLLVTSPGNAPDTWRKIKTIDFQNGKSVFELYENN